ncbi:MAG: response regulator [Acidobacteriia bacterium]|nr:response regulator [Terriglobia bacterium]
MPWGILEETAQFVEPQRWRTLLEEANVELRARLFRGIYAYPVMMAVLAFSTRSFQQHPRLMCAAAGTMLAGLLFRASLMACRKALCAENPTRWRALAAGSVALIAGSCGVMHAALLLLYGWESWPFAVSMIWIAGLSTGGCIAFLPYLDLVCLHLLLMEAPVFLVSLWRGGVEGDTFAVTVALFVLFLLAQSRRLHVAYWRGLVDRALEAARRGELEALSQAKSRFLANMSHEIRTPMHGILGMAQLLQAADCPPEQRDFYVETLYGSAKGLLQVLNAVLDFSKIEAGKLRLENIPFEVRAVVEETRQILVAQAESKGLRLHCAVRADVPFAVRGDPVRLRQVLLNLAANAVKFTESGSVGMLVGLEKRAEDSVKLRFQVEDTGVGIAKEKLAGIFDAFTQADASVTRRFGATGLGLAISAQIVQLMEGRIHVESEPGVGSTFSFTCRFGRAAAPNSPPAELPPAPLRILLAEDNLVNQTVAVRLLEKQGHSVRLAATGRQAVDALSAESFDLVLMDNQMPELSGVEAARAIRASGCDVPIVGCSADAMNGDRERFLAAGMNACLSKPFRAEELYAVVGGFAPRRPAPPAAAATR